ncbi:MAG: endo alpha-1,4 polygalactosaminidase [Deinococcales bacterium]
MASTSSKTEKESLEENLSFPKTALTALGNNFAHLFKSENGTVEPRKHANPSIIPKGHPLKLYYGFEALRALSHFERVVLQMNHYSYQDLALLKDQGVTPLAYISLGEDFAQGGKWQRQQCNQDWQTHYVKATHPLWQKKLLGEAKAALDKGFQGFLLDNLDVVDLFPEDRSALLDLIALISKLLAAHPKRYLLVNRGFSLFPEMLGYLDGFIFESFSVRWQVGGGARALSESDLAWTSLKAQELLRLKTQKDFDLYALDYCHEGKLSQFARFRALQHQMIHLSSNRELTLI